MPYEDNNIFAMIIRGDVPCDKVYEDEQVLAFNDISPQAPVHIIVIPKGPYVDIHDFSSNAAEDELVALFRAVGTIVKEQDLDKKGFRVISNCGAHGGQEVPHLHLHILAGRKLGRMVAAA